jgi:hypothetical protein
MNYTKLMMQNPFELDRMMNDKGQLITFYEHPHYGDEYPVLIVCHEQELVDHTDFYDTSDMTATHGEYQPSFINRVLHIGGYPYRS